jgi:hypothetical protein
VTKKLWPIEADADDPNVPHVTVPCARCPIHLFVAKDHPALPDGPFFCAEHSDAPPTMAPDYTEADLICDRCGTKLTAQASTREEALARLWELVATERWDSTLDGAASDLCTTCKPS